MHGYYDGMLAMGIDPATATADEIVAYERRCVQQSQVVDPEAVFPAAADEPIFVDAPTTVIVPRIVLVLPKE